MASINTIVKRKQYLWLGIVVVGAASAIGGALYLSDVDMSGNGETVAEQEPVPDMTGVVDTTFDDKVRQHATTEMQVTAAQMQKQYEEIRRELDVLNKQRGDDQRRIEKLGQDNAALAEQVKALGANPVTATGEPVPQMPASPPGPEGEPQPGNTPVFGAYQVLDAWIARVSREEREALEARQQAMMEGQQEGRHVSH